MWLRLPSGTAEPENPDAGAPARSEDPTYEDPWYQVLRRRLGDRSSSD